MLRVLRDHLQALRPHQWVKNGFVLAPLVFSRQLLNIETLQVSAIAALAFSLVSSSIYLVNDSLDYARDQQHPEKRHRPIASGRVRRPVAIALSLLCAVLGLSLASTLGPGTIWVIGAYGVMNLAYSLGLKQILLIDVFMIAFGFLLRVTAGAFAIQVKLSPWLLLCTLLLALFLALCKRRHERSSLGEEAAAHRELLARYTLPFLDQLITSTAAMTVMSYALYTIDPWVISRLGTNGLILTLPFVLLGIFRYLAIVHLEDGGGSPTKVALRDRSIQLIIGLYLVVAIVCIYYQLNLDLTPRSIS